MRIQWQMVSIRRAAYLVTEGDKMQAEKDIGWSINTYVVGGFVERVNAVTEQEINAKLEEWVQISILFCFAIAFFRTFCCYDIILHFVLPAFMDFLFLL